MIRLIGLGILLIPCIITDVRRQELPVVYILIFSAAALAGNLVFHWVETGDMISGAVLGLLFLLAARLPRGGLGLGDGFLILAAGIFSGGTFTVPLLLGTFLLTAVLGSGYLILSGKGIRTRLPLAPFMGLSGLILGVLFIFLPEVGNGAV